jgi:hypothetical protein
MLNYYEIIASETHTSQLGCNTKRYGVYYLITTLVILYLKKRCLSYLVQCSMGM